MLRNYIELLRVKQWIKNLFVVAPLFFSGRFADGDALSSVALAFVAFCLMSSAIYCMNDVTDYRNDAKHEKKRHRPVASGKISRTSAIITAMILAVASLSIAFAVNIQLLAVLCIYMVLNVLYSLGLKRIAVLDVLIVASGFVLRLFAGGVATGVVLSKWIVIATFLLALFLAFAKRRDDVLILERTGVKMRESVENYSIRFIDAALASLAAAIIICYVMYTIDSEVGSHYNSPYLYLTAVFVIAGVLRYLQRTIRGEKSGSPTEAIYHDIFLILCIVGWIASIAAILYL